MGLTRKALKAMGLTDEQVDSVAEAHGETINALQDKIKDLEAKVADYDAVTKERDELKTADWKAKYEKERDDYAAYKKQTEEKAEKAAKSAAARAYFESKNITGANLEIALRGAKDEIGSLTLDNGKIKDASALDELIGGTFAGLVGKSEVRGAKTATPPASGKTKPTREEIEKIEDTDARQKAIAENLDLFT